MPSHGIIVPIVLRQYIHHLVPGPDHTPAMPAGATIVYWALLIGARSLIGRTGL